MCVPDDFRRICITSLLVFIRNTWSTEVGFPVLNTNKLSVCRMSIFGFCCFLLRSEAPECAIKCSNPKQKKLRCCYSFISSVTIVWGMTSVGDHGIKACHAMNNGLTFYLFHIYGQSDSTQVLCNVMSTDLYQHNLSLLFTSPMTLWCYDAMTLWRYDGYFTSTIIQMDFWPV